MSDLPKGWVEAKLRDLAACEPNSMSDGPFGSNLKSDHYRLSGARVVRLGNIGLGQFLDQDKVFIDQDHFASLSRHQCLGGDLVIAALADPVGRCAIVPIDIGPAIVKADCIRMKPHASVNGTYLMRCLNSPEGLNRTASASHGIGRLRINLGELKQIDVPLAPLAEQHRIVAKLDDLLARSRRAKEELAAIPALLERYRQSVLAAAFRGDLTADWRAKNPEVEPASALLARIRVERRRRWEEEELARLTAKGKAPTDERWKERYEAAKPLELNHPKLSCPETWTWVSIEEIAQIVTGGTPPGRIDGCYGGETPFVKPTDLDAEDNVSLARTYLSKRGEGFVELVPAGSTMVTCIGTIGKAGLAQVPCATNQQINTAVPSRLVDPAFLYWCIRSPVSQEWLRSNASATTISILNKGRFSRMPTPLPPYSEQCAISAILSKIFLQLNALPHAIEQQANELIQLENAILTRAFRGELVPQDPKDEPASVLLARIRAEREAAPVKKKPGRRPRNAS